MSTSTKVGRLSKSKLGQPVQHDAPEEQSKAVMSKLDELIGAIKTLTAKLDADVGVTDTNYAALVSDTLKEIVLKQ